MTDDLQRDHDLDDLVRNEVAGWAPRGAPDMRDVLRRADHGWQRPVLAYSGAAAGMLALILVASLVIVLLGAHMSVTDGIRERLLAH